MRHLLVLLALASTAAAIPPIRITNREYPDRSGSSRETDPSKRQAVETFYDSSRKMTHKIVYKLDERLQPQSGIFYNAKGVIYQKSTYLLDAEDRIIQEVIYNAQGKLLCTKNYTHSSSSARAGYAAPGSQATIVKVDTYDANGNLILTPQRPSSSGRSR